MTRNRYYTTVVPIAAILYVIAILALHGKHVSSIGAMILAIVVLAGAFLRPPAGTDGRQRERRRYTRT